VGSGPLSAGLLDWAEAVVADSDKATALRLRTTTSIEASPATVRRLAEAKCLVACLQPAPAAVLFLIPLIVVPSLSLSPAAI